MVVWTSGIVVTARDGDLIWSSRDDAYAGLSPSPASSSSPLSSCPVNLCTVLPDSISQMKYGILFCLMVY